jgi:hypothetical protein
MCTGLAAYTGGRISWRVHRTSRKLPTTWWTWWTTRGLERHNRGFQPLHPLPRRCLDVRIAGFHRIAAVCDNPTAAPMVAILAAVNIRICRTDAGCAGPMPDLPDAARPHLPGRRHHRERLDVHIAGLRPVAHDERSEPGNYLFAPLVNDFTTRSPSGQRFAPDMETLP